MSNLDAALHELVANLHDQVRIYRHMLALSQAQVDALQRHDVNAVQAVLQDIEHAMLERSKVDQRRTRAIEGVAAAINRPVEHVTATLLEQLAPGTDGQAIATASAELKALIRELDDVVARSSALLQHELQLIDFMMHGLTAVRETPIYERAGVQADVGRRSILDTAV
jgi:hypothetical protein